MKKHVMVQQLNGLTFMGKGDSGHWTIIDGPGELGGNDGGPRPKELLLLSLAGCTGSDVASILTKKRTPYSRLDVHVTADMRDEHPRIFTGVHVEYIVHGENIRSRDVERAIELSETTYCAVSAMLRASVPITSSYRIENARTGKAVRSEEEVAS